MSLLALALLSSDPAAAGPWLRDRDTVFLSFGANLALSEGARLPVHHDPHLYAEWGLSDRLTLVFSAFSADAGQEMQVGLLAVTAAPVALPDTDAASLSFGIVLRQLESTDEPQPLFVTGAAWGRGLPRGWLTVEAVLSLGRERTEGKVDLTWGHRLSDRWTGIVQLTAGSGHTGDIYSKVAPTAVYRLSDRLRLTGGLVQGLTGDRGTGLALGAWVEF